LATIRSSSIIAGLFSRAREIPARNLLISKENKEIESKVIGREVCAELKRVDKVAYLRFVSVYRQFKDPGDFTKELAALVS
jgi:transcriptional repressor NrdR